MAILISYCFYYYLRENIRTINQELQYCVHAKMQKKDEVKTKPSLKQTISVKQMRKITNSAFKK